MGKLSYEDVGLQDAKLIVFLHIFYDIHQPLVLFLISCHPDKVYLQKTR